MKGRKFMLMSVVTLLVVFLTAGTALADSPWDDRGNKGKGKGNQKQIQVQVQVQQKVKNQAKVNKKVSDWNFTDVSENHWACKRIKAMAKQGIIKGYGKGIFRPNASVSKIEALTMIVRLTENVDGEDLWDAAKDRKYYWGVPLWAQGYVKAAIKANIIDADELDNFRPNAAAKRYEVAILLGRALDVDTDDDYDDLNFKDEKQIPKEALEYLPYLVEEGYITGYNNGKFMPNKPVTRAELANILAKVSGDLDEDDEDVDVDILDQFRAQGTITDIDGDSLTLKIKNSKKEFTVDDDVIGFVDNRDADYDDLEEGFKAIVLYDKDGDENEVLVIYARSCDDAKDCDNDDDDEEDIEEVEGIFKSADDDLIEILVDGDEEDYDLAKDVEVEIDNKDADVDDLLPGMEVELKIDTDDDEVVEINADELVEIKGELVSYDEDDAEIVIKFKGEKFTYNLSEDVEVEIDGEEEELDDLERGMDVELTFDDGEVVKVEAED